MVWLRIVSDTSDTGLIKMPNETTLQKTVTQQRQALKDLLFESMSEVAQACSKQMHDRKALEAILADEMTRAEYCKYLWVLESTHCN